MVRKITKNNEKTSAEIKFQKLNLPIITKKEFSDASSDSWDLFYLLLSKYYEILYLDPAEGLHSEADVCQHTLMAYNILFGEVTNGGFLQLIHNGYADYIFSTSFSKTLHLWGASSMASIINKAAKIYLKNKIEIEVERSTNELSDLYSKYPEFNSLDHKFFHVMYSETEVIKNYILRHTKDFAMIC
ncbi:DMP19 family protein [Flavobacterium foetidum]|uniref:DMP19 family protein n=1 Tax=Flavobacterium foetidum TaxID=2026681 RepID=UPI001074C099|nr:DMP19 family protein [Flavobacterium foetidum]KAF2515580.1 DMP19 family protein [Flavobacterium foetidum]